VNQNGHGVPHGNGFAVKRARLETPLLYCSEYRLVDTRMTWFCQMRVSDGALLVNCRVDNWDSAPVDSLLDASVEIWFNAM